MPLTRRTQKVLWGSSANRCAVCRRELVIKATSADPESVVGEECHIISALPQGPRYHVNYPAEKIDDAKNLILLCAVHHKMVDDQCETYSAEVLRKLKLNHEKWVRASLAEERRIPPLNLRRLKENIPSHLIRITSGRDLLKVVTDADEFRFDNPEPKSEEELQLLASFLQEAQDFGDLASDFEAGERVNAAFVLSKSIEELERAGFWVFGGREVARLEGGIGGPAKWVIAITEIRKSTDHQIIRVDIGGSGDTLPK